MTQKTEYQACRTWYSSPLETQSGGGGDGLCEEVDEVNWVLEGGEPEIEQGGV